ncbi:hypothetical protein TUBRATIS_26860, partial [Tubulinosema ratisbonensis]
NPTLKALYSEPSINNLKTFYINQLKIFVFHNLQFLLCRSRINCSDLFRQYEYISNNFEQRIFDNLENTEEIKRMLTKDIKKITYSYKNETLDVLTLKLALKRLNFSDKKLNDTAIKLRNKFLNACKQIIESIYDNYLVMDAQFDYIREKRKIFAEDIYENHYIPFKSFYDCHDIPIEYGKKLFNPCKLYDSENVCCEYRFIPKNTSQSFVESKVDWRKFN